MSRTILGALALVVCLCAGTPASGEEGTLPVTADAAADLAKALDAWDHRERGAFSDTIPFEKAVLRAGAEAKPDDVVAHVGHERFGALLFSLLCERRPTGGAATKLAEAFAAMPADRRADSALAFGALATDAARAALRALLAEETVGASSALRETVRAALVRAGDGASIAEVRKGLASKEAAEAAAALLRAGDARATSFLAEAARLADDPRKLTAPVPSRWSETRTTRSEDGLAARTETLPVRLDTVGAAAVEAANRMFATTVPDWVAWWYEIEKGPRFGRGPGAVKLLRQVAADDARAAKPGAPSFETAVRAVQSAVRPTAPEMAEWKLVSAAYDRGWEIGWTLGGAPGTASVDAAGRVTLH